MSETKQSNQGAVTSIADTDLVMCVANGSYHPISFDNLMNAIRDGIQVGGRNLALNSAPEKSGSYQVAIINLSEPWENGKEYIMSFQGSIGEGKTPYFQIWDGRGHASVFICSEIEDGVYRGVFKPVGLDYTETERSLFKIYAQPASVSTICAISKVKFERGNVATDWTPAPEDIASGAWGGVIGYLPITCNSNEEGGAHDGDETTYQRPAEGEDDGCNGDTRACVLSRRHEDTRILYCCFRLYDYQSTFPFGKSSRNSRSDRQIWWNSAKNYSSDSRNNNSKIFYVVFSYLDSLVQVHRSGRDILATERRAAA